MTSKFPTNSKRGFTLIEMLIAVLLLTTAVAGPMTIASRGITASTVAKDQVTAFFLAQDAVEYIRYQRDTNKLAGDDWLTGIGGTTAPGGCEGARGCLIDATGNDVGSSVQHPIGVCGPGAGSTCGSPLLYNTETKRFTYINAGATTDFTIFRRHVKMVELSADEVELEVRVIWCYDNNLPSCAEDPDSKEVVVRENLLDWH